MSTVTHFFHAGGFVMYPLLVLSITAVAVIVERSLAFRQFGYLSPGLLANVERLCTEGQTDQALEITERQRGPLAAALAVILRHRHLPVREVERMVEETGQEYFIRLERYLPVLDTTTTISPLLGLLGTIVGMIGTFNAIATQQAHGNNDAVLTGVGEALYATASGILIAVVCFVAYNYFAARLRTVTAETEQASTRLINVLTELRRDEHARQNHHEAADDAALGERTHGIQATARA